MSCFIKAGTFEPDRRYLVQQQLFATKNRLLRYPLKTIQQNISWVLVTFWVEGLAPLVHSRKIRDRISALNFGCIDWTFRVFPHSLNAAARVVTYTKPRPRPSACVPILCKGAMNQNIRYNKTCVSYNVLILAAVVLKVRRDDVKYLVA